MIKVDLFFPNQFYQSLSEHSLDQLKYFPPTAVAIANDAFLQQLRLVHSFLAILKDPKRSFFVVPYRTKNVTKETKYVREWTCVALYDLVSSVTYGTHCGLEWLCGLLMVFNVLLWQNIDLIGFQSSLPNSFGLVLFENSSENS